MSRWTIEKDGTGIEKSGTGVEKSGTGIEKSGTGIEKSGTGIEKSGTGIQRFIIACVIAMVSFAGNLQAGNLSPSGSLQLVVDQDTIAVSWIIDGSVFSGVAPLTSSFASLNLTEISLDGLSSGLEVTGNGTGSSILVTGNGTGNSVQVTGNGTGGSAQVTGNGTGISVQVTGNGTDSSTQVTGNGTGSSTLVTGNGTGSTILVTGNGTGTEAIAITLPDGTGLAMNIALGCRSATVAVLDVNFAPVAMFNNVSVVGDTGLCSGASGARVTRPGFDFIAN
jgi:hypothetical protein